MGVRQEGVTYPPLFTVLPEGLRISWTAGLHIAALSSPVLGVTVSGWGLGISVESDPQGEGTYSVVFLGALMLETRERILCVLSSLEHCSSFEDSCYLLRDK